MPVHHIVTTHRAWKSGRNRAYENVPLSYPRKVDFQAGQLSFLLPQWAKSLGSHLPTKYKSPTIKTFAEFESCLSEEQVGIQVFSSPEWSSSYSLLPIYTPGWQEALSEYKNKDPGSNTLTMRPPHLHISLLCSHYWVILQCFSPTDGGEALRDDLNNSCKGDYLHSCLTH